MIKFTFIFIILYWLVAKARASTNNIHIIYGGSYAWYDKNKNINLLNLSSSPYNYQYVSSKWKLVVPATPTYY